MPKATHVSAAFPWIKLAILGCALFFYTSGVYAGKADHSREHSVKNFSCWTGEPLKASHLREEPLENSGVLETAGEKAVILEYERYIVFNHTETALMTCLKDREEPDAEILVKVFETTEKDEDSDEDNDPLSAGDEIGFQWFFRHLADLFLKRNLFGEAAPDSKDDYPDAPSAPYSPFGGDMLEGSLIPDFKELTIKPKAWSMPWENIELIVSKKKVPDRPEKMFRGFRSRYILQSGIIVEVGPDFLWIPGFGLPEEDKLTRALRRVIECDVGRRRCSEVNTELRQLQALENVLIELSVAGEPVVPALGINLEDLPWLTYQQLERLSGRIRAYLNTLDPQTLDEMSLENLSIPFRTALLQIIDQISEAHSALLQSRKTGFSNDLGKVRRDLSMVLSANINGQLAMMNRAVSERDARIYEMLIESIRQLKVETEIEEKNQELKAEIRKWEEIQSMPEDERRAETVAELKKRMAEIKSRLNVLGLEQARLSGTLDNILSVIPPTHSIESGTPGMGEPTDADKDDTEKKKEKIGSSEKGGKEYEDEESSDEINDERSDGGGSAGSGGNNDDDGKGEKKTPKEDEEDEEDEESEYEKKLKKMTAMKKKALKIGERKISLEDRLYIQEKLEEMTIDFEEQDPSTVIKRMKKLEQLGPIVMEHLEFRLKELLMLSPYRSGDENDKEVKDLKALSLVFVLREALINGRSMLAVNFISEVATGEDVSRFRTAMNPRSNPSIHLGRMPEPLRAEEWDVRFSHDDQEVPREAVIELLNQMEHVQIITRNNGLVTPTDEEKERWRRQYYSDGERVNVRIIVKKVRSSEPTGRMPRTERRTNILRSTVVFDTQVQRRELTRRNISGGQFEAGMNQVASDIPDYLLPEDEQFAFILQLLLNQNSSTQIVQIIFGGVLNKVVLTNGLLHDHLGSYLIGKAST